jgi:hypothetical protein
MKQMFEKQQQGGSEFTSEQREEIGSLKRSEADRKKILAAFMEVSHFEGVLEVSGM